MKKSFLNLKYRVKISQEIIATFYIESDLPLEKAAIEIAKESSIGTWTELTTSTQKIFNRLAPQIFSLNRRLKIIKIAYPLELFEPGNLPQLLSGLAGNIFSMKIVKNLRLVDLDFPNKYLASYPGPALGINGIRKILRIYNRPIIGSIIKPKVGLTASEQAQLTYTIWKNGVDLVKDDENLTSLNFNKFSDRVKKVLLLKRQVEKETGQKKIYVFNVTAPADLLLKRAKLVKKLGGNCVMIDIVSAGLANVQYLRKQNLGLIIHGHRAGHSMFTRNPRHGMSMLVLAKLARLTGIDQLHTGTVVGKMEGGTAEVRQINNFLKSPWHNLKPVLPIASGGLHPALVPKLVKILGKDLVINFGGGLHGHPGGSAAGAKACSAAVSAVMANQSLKKYSIKSTELKQALAYWGR